MELADWLKVAAVLAVALTAHIKGDRIVGKLEDLRAEMARGTANVSQVGTDLGELLDRIAANLEAGDPTDEDIASAKAIADSLAAHGAALDSTLAGGGEPTPEPTPEP